VRIERLTISWERTEHIAEHGVTPAEAREALEQGQVFRGPKSDDGGRTYIVRGRTYAGRPLRLLVKPLGRGLAFLITAYEDR
jgi:hypothetical protein